MKKHTTGPWEVTRYGDGQYSIYPKGEKGYTEEGIDDAEDISNAELIAAAPDLLAERDRLREVNAELIDALSRMEEWVEEIDDEDSRVPIDIRWQASAALKKARAFGMSASVEDGIGRLLWKADDLKHAKTTAYVLESKGCEIVSIDKAQDCDRYYVIISLPKAHANEILGYEVGEEEWLKTEPLLETKSFPKPSGC